MTRDNTGDDVLEKGVVSLENDTGEKVHPWRRCPKGAHFVKEHDIHHPPSKEHPNGFVAKGKAYCASNPSHQDELSYSEIQYIAETYFDKLPGPPTAGKLTLVFPIADTYDREIRGWVSYWNDIFMLADPLDADFIKALIGTESGFRKKPPENLHAHGLMQIIHETFVVLQNPKGELRDYLIRVPWNKILEPVANICMGVRWLFHKRKLASGRLKREATWEEAVIEYKCYWDEVKAGKIPKGISDLRRYYQILRG